MATKDHQVTITTRNGDTNTQMMTEKDARAAEDLPFADSSNIASTSVNPPR
jgi:hypothetical protein